jgi:hypothetical protein
MFKKILVISCVLILQSCASSKGYIGEKRPSSELATIYKADIQKYGTVAKQWVHIQQINDLIVGTDMKGYPSKIEVLPGNVRIIVKFETMTLGAAVLSGTGQVVGGAIGAGMTDTAKFISRRGNNEIYTSVKKGQSYKINFSSKTHSINDLKVWLEPYTPEK